MKNTSIDKMADLRRDEIDGFLLKLNANNLIVISQNLNIGIKGETNKRNVLRLVQRHIDGIEGEEHLTAIKGFERNLSLMLLQMEIKKMCQHRCKVTDDETKGALPGKSL